MQTVRQSYWPDVVPPGGSIEFMESAEKKEPLAARFLVLEGLAWFTIVVIAWWWTLSSTVTDLRSVIYFTSSLSIVAGIRGFLGHGCTAVTATGLFSISTAMFIGYSGFVLAGQASPDAEWKYVALASVAGLTAQVGTTALAWRRKLVPVRRALWFDSYPSNFIFGAGLMVLALAAGMHIVMPQLRSWTESAAFTAICLIAVGIILRKNARLFSWGTMLVGATLIVYAEFFHSGTGRLRLVALACAIAVIYSIRFPLRRLKWAIVLIIPFALIWMANDRLDLQESLSTGASAGRTGLESMVAPLNVFSLLIETLHEQGFQPAYGYNLLSVPSLVIPEFIWPGQPMALGYELVQFYSPGKYGDGIYSTVASSTGEGIFNFGWVGLPVVIIFAACALRLLDSLLERQLSSRQADLLKMLGVVLVAMLIGAIADYTWSGVHTYTARMLGRLPMFLVVLVVVLIHLRLKSRRVNGISRVRKHQLQTNV